MRWTYDSDVEALYVYLRDLPVTRQLSVDDRFVLDLADDGAVVGVEVLDAQAPWSPSELIGAAYLPAEDLRSLALIAGTWHQCAGWAPVGRAEAQPVVHTTDLAPVYA